MSNLGLRSGNRKSRSSLLELVTGFYKYVVYRKQLGKNPTIDHLLYLEKLEKSKEPSIFHQLIF